MTNRTDMCTDDEAKKKRRENRNQTKLNNIHVQATEQKRYSLFISTHIACYAQTSQNDIERRNKEHIKEVNCGKKKSNKRARIKAKRHTKLRKYEKSKKKKNGKKEKTTTQK